MNLSKFTMPKIHYLRENLNLTEQEEVVFSMLVKNKSILEISHKMSLSESTISRRIRAIKDKMNLLE